MVHIIHNGKVILENEILASHAVVIEGETIKAIIPEERIVDYPDVTKLDANGGYIFPRGLSIFIPIT